MTNKSKKKTRLFKQRHVFKVEDSIDSLSLPDLGRGVLVPPRQSDPVVVGVSPQFDREEVADPVVSLLEEKSSRPRELLPGLNAALGLIASKRLQFGLLGFGSAIPGEAMAALAQVVLDRAVVEDPEVKAALDSLKYQIVQLAYWRLLFSRGVVKGAEYKFSQQMEIGAESEEINAFSNSLKTLDKATAGAKVGNSKVAQLESLIETAVTSESSRSRTNRIAISVRQTATEEFMFKADESTQLCAWQLVERIELHRTQVGRLSGEEYAWSRGLLDLGLIDALELPSTTIHYVTH